MGLWPFSDRRQYPRWRIAMNVIYGVGDDMTATTTVDVSESSISVFARRKYELGHKLEVHLAVNGTDHWVTVKGKVTRCDNGVVAIQFLNFGNKDMAELGAFLREQAKLGKSELVAVV